MLSRLYSSISQSKISSFSSEEYEQVEYSRYPWLLKQDITSDRMRCCLSLQSFTFASDHASILSSSLRNIPEPEHGASTTNRSKNPGNLRKAVGSLFVTTTFGYPQRIKFS